MKQLLAFLLLSTLIICSLSSCKKDVGGKDVTNIITLPANGSSVVAANNHFAFKFLQAALQSDSGYTNKLVSPLSIYLALSMVYNGADHATKDSMITALQLSGLNISDLNATCKALIEQLPGEDNKVALSIANSIWYRQGNIQPLQSFLDVNSNYFNATVRGLDFDNPSSVDVINNWVSTNTQGKIPKIISALSHDDLMFLVNAIYFKGAWLNAFKTQDTYNDNFYLQDGSSVSTPFMKQDITVNEYLAPGYRVVELPYGGGNSYSMYLVSGDNTQSINELAGNMNETILKDAIARMSKNNVTVMLPRWEYSYSIDDMRPELAALGMDIAFTNNADFSKMYNVPVQITKAIHKTYVKVDEDGTTAAAVTGIGIGLTSVGASPNLKFDHPFIYVIAEKQTGTILFTGIVNDPTKQ